MNRTDAEQESERRRQAELDALALTKFAETAYDDLVALAASTMSTPVALISIIDGDRQWFKARVGLNAEGTPRDVAFCALAIEEADQVLVVPDARADARFSANPLVTGAPHIRYYVGVPLVTSSGQAVGTICAIDTEARVPTTAQLDELRFLARQVVAMMERRQSSSNGGQASLGTRSDIRLSVADMKPKQAWRDRFCECLMELAPATTRINAERRTVEAFAKDPAAEPASAAVRLWRSKNSAAPSS